MAQYMCEILIFTPKLFITLRKNGERWNTLAKKTSLRRGQNHNSQHPDTIQSFCPSIFGQKAKKPKKKPKKKPSNKVLPRETNLRGGGVP